MDLAAIGGMASGAVRGEWRRGSTWRVGLASLDPSTGVLRPLNDRRPTLSPEMLRDDRTTLVADPFILRHQGAWYLFFEGMDPGGHGDIRLARSSDLRTWEYVGVIVRASHHLSYPTVHVLADRIMLIVESSATFEVRAYVADAFPTRWSEANALLEGKPYADPTLFHYEGRWWLFTEVSGGSHNRLEAYWCQDASWSRWRPHDRNPLVNDQRFARPAGTPFTETQGRLLRFSQDCSRIYGERVAAIEISTLTPSDYEERFRAWIRFAAPTPAWAALRQHHVSPFRGNDDGMAVVVDGRGWLTIPQAMAAGVRGLGRSPARGARR